MIGLKFWNRSCDAFRGIQKKIGFRIFEIFILGRIRVTARSKFKFTFIAISPKPLGLLGWYLVWWCIFVGWMFMYCFMTLASRSRSQLGQSSNSWLLHYLLNYWVFGLKFGLMVHRNGPHVYVMFFMTMTLSLRSQLGRRSNLRLMLYLLKYAVSWVEIWCDDVSWSVGYLGKVSWPCPQSQGHSSSMFKFTIIAISLKLLGLLDWNSVWWYILVGLDRSNYGFYNFP